MRLSSWGPPEGHVVGKRGFWPFEGGYFSSCRECHDSVARQRDRYLVVERLTRGNA